MCRLIITFLFLFFTASVFAADLKISKAFLREPPTASKITSAYMTITNNSTQDDFLIGVRSSLAYPIQLHTTHIDANNIAKMSKKSRISILAGEAVNLQSGGDHLMLMGLQSELQIGQVYPLTLIFAKAGEMEIYFEVRGIADTLQKSHEH